MNQGPWEELSARQQLGGPWEELSAGQQLPALNTSASLLGSYGPADLRDLVGRGLDCHCSVKNVSPKLHDQSIVSEFKRLNSPEEPLTQMSLNLPI